MKSRPTYLLIEDLPDVPNEPRDLEAEQEENLQAALGGVLWAILCQMEDEECLGFTRQCTS